VPSWGSSAHGPKKFISALALSMPQVGSTNNCCPSIQFMHRLEF
jgi:hypothetical protein